MLYFLFGEDTFRSRQALRELIEELSADKDSALSRIGSDDFQKESFWELARGTSLFGGRKIIVCENLFQETSAAEFSEKNLKFCADSEDIFIFREEGTKIPAIDKLKKNAGKVEEFKILSPNQIRNWLEKEFQKKGVKMPLIFREELIKRCGGNLWLLSRELEKRVLGPDSESFPGSRPEETNFFRITDAFSEKNRSGAWLLLEKAVLAGADAEEIFWKIVWQVKNLLIVKKFVFVPEGKIAEQTRLHPFVIKKAVSGAKFFTEEELSRYSSELINLYHNSRRGLADFETGIEKFLIRL